MSLSGSRKSSAATRCDADLIGREDKFEGVIDLITMKGLYFDGANGETVREEAIPANLQKEATAARVHMLEALYDVQRQLMEMLLSGGNFAGADPRPGADHSDRADHAVFLGAAYRDEGVQPLLNADAAPATCPRRSTLRAKARTRRDQNKIIELQPDDGLPFVGMAFKIINDKIGQLTFTRVYQGKIEKGGACDQADQQEGTLRPDREDARRQAQEETDPRRGRRSRLALQGGDEGEVRTDAV